jgi:DNA-nicking Smr family endonuclease
MNFGDIFDKWEKTNEIHNKDLEAGSGRFSPQERRSRLRNKKPDTEIDIHGLSRDEAWMALENFFNDSKAKGLEKLLVIHGKGNHSAGEAVLKRIVMEFIEHCPFAGESGRGKAAAGGEGATWVLLK